MIEITLGLVITAVSILGVIGCVIALIATGPIFKKQRSRLLDQIEEE